MSNKRKGYINRDNNAVKNMISITLQHIKDRTRPYHFMRGVKNISNQYLDPNMKITIFC